MTYILLIVFIINDHHVSMVQIDGYPSQESCDKAGAQIKTELVMKPRFKVWDYVCVSKYV